jgi:hypothetical protein
MGCSAQPPRPPRRPSLVLFRSGRPVLRSILRKEPPPRLSLQVGPARRKRNPIEPIELNYRRLNDMRRFLINRSHWSYLAAAESFTAKKCPILANSVRPRARTQWRTVRPRAKTSKAGMCFIITKVEPDGGRATPRTRIWCEDGAGRRRQRGSASPMPKNDPGMSFRIRGKPGEGSLPRPNFGLPHDRERPFAALRTCASERVAMRNAKTCLWRELL